MNNLTKFVCFVFASLIACLLVSGIAMPASVFGYTGSTSGVTYSGNAVSSGGSSYYGGSSSGSGSYTGSTSNVTYSGNAVCSGGSCGSTSSGYTGSTSNVTYSGNAVCSGSSCGGTTYTYTNTCTSSCCGSNCYHCTNDCTSGQRVCSGSGYKTCSKGSDGCYHWGSIVSCGSGYTCSNGSCIKTCSNECSTSGKRECSGNGYRTCGNYDSDSCLEWGTVTNCGTGYTCSNGSCIKTCTNECSVSGRRECSGNGFRTCNMGSDGCYHWSTVTDCDSDESCSNGSCVTTCTNECSTNGQRVCSGNGYKTCGNYDSDSCREWSTVTDCDDDQTCDNGSCVDKHIDICNDTLSGSPTSKQQQMCSDAGGTMLCGNGWCKCNCAKKPTVDLTYTGSGTCGSNYTLKWTTTNATNCEAEGGWDGSKGINGSQSVGNFDGSKTFTLNCWGKGGTATDSVTLQGSGDDNLDVDAGDDVTVDEGETVKLDGSVDGDYDDLDWECTGGELSSESTLRPTFEAPSKHYDYDKIYTCTLTASNECGEDSDTMKVRVNAEEVGDLDVTLSVDPSSGCAALNDVDLKAEVDDDSNNEDYKYFFDCENDGDWDKTETSDNDSYTAKNICDYDEPGTYTAKVKVTSNGRTATDTATIKVKDCDTHEETEGNLSITKTVQNVSTGADYAGQVFAQPGQVVGYKIVVKAVGGDLKNVTLTDRIPSGITNVSALIINGKKSSGDLEQGIDLGDINEGNSIVVTYLASVAGESNFGFGQNSLTNTATASADGNSVTGQATVVVSRQAVYAATAVSTGFDGGAGAMIAAVMAGLVLAAGYALKGGKLKFRKDSSELDKKIDYIKKNNLIG